MIRAVVAWGVVFALPACVKSDPPDPSSTEPRPARASPPGSAVAARAVGAARIEITPSVERSCRQICDRSVLLRCASVDKCLPNCLAMGSATPCTDEILRFYDCLVAQPVQNWECAPDGVAAIKRGLCDAEQGRTVACMEAKLTAAGP